MSRLGREEYVEQAYFFRSLVERIGENEPLQELMAAARDEVLSTTKLPLAVDYLLAELRHAGVFAPAMARLKHYFTPFQTYLIRAAEDEEGRFDLRIALDVLRREAEFRSETPTLQGAFLFQFEILCRNRLSYDRGLKAMAADDLFDDDWKRWIQEVRLRLGLFELADLIYVRSAYYDRGRAAARDSDRPRPPVLFGEKEGKIALANRKKDPLLLFSALQRQLGYPAVPRPKPRDATPELVPLLMRRVERLETRLKLLEEEQREGAIDITKFYDAHRGPG